MCVQTCVSCAPTKPTKRNQFFLFRFVDSIAQRTNFPTASQLLVDSTKNPYNEFPANISSLSNRFDMSLNIATGLVDQTTAQPTTVHRNTRGKSDWFCSVGLLANIHHCDVASKRWKTLPSSAAQYSSIFERWWFLLPCGITCSFADERNCLKFILSNGWWTINKNFDWTTHRYVSAFVCSIHFATRQIEVDAKY